MKKIVLILFCVILCTSALFVSFEKDSKKPVKIEFSSWGSQSETSFLKPLIKQFENENPNIEVEFVHIPQNYFQKLHLLFASNLAPDVVFLNNYYAPKYYKAGLLEDLTPYVDKEAYFDKALQSFSFEGEIYAIPRDISDLVIYYNKDLFDKYKVPYPDKNWKTQDFINIAKKLTKDTDGDGKTDVWGTSFETDMFYLLPYIFSNGGSVLSEDGERIKIGEKPSLEAISEYSNYPNKYKIAPSKSDSASLTMAQLFLQQKIAMHLSGRWLVPKYREDADFDWDIAPFPQGLCGSVVNIDSSGYALSKSSLHKKEALKFIEFISSRESLETLTKSGLIVPARKDSANSDSFLNKNYKPEHAHYFIDAIETGKATPVNAYYQKITDRLNSALEPVFLGKKSALEVLNKGFIENLSRKN